MCYQKEFERLLENVFLQSSAFTAAAVGKRPTEENNYTIFVTVNELLSVSDEVLGQILQQNVLTYFTLRPHEEYIEKYMPHRYVRLYYRFKELNKFASYHGHKVDREELEGFLRNEAADFEMTKEDIDRIKGR